MPLLCATCNQRPLPVLPSWYEEAERWSNAHANIVHSTDYLPPEETRETLEEYVENLEKELKMAKRTLEVTRARSAPINKLVNEILLQIFEQVYYISDTYNHDGYHINPEINSISAVCKRWHEIVLSSPRYWTTIALGDSASLQANTLKRKMEAHTKRARELPLTLKVQDADVLARAMDRIMGPCFNRITVLDIKQRITYLGDQEIFDSCKFPPDITHLIMDVEEAGHDSDEPDPVALNEDISVYIEIPTGSMPRLTSVKLDVGPPISRLKLPWAQLTALDVEVDHLKADIFPIISSLQRVEILAINGKYGGIGGDGSKDWSSLTLPRLQSLKVVTVGHQDLASCLLRYPSYPSLAVLKVKDYDLYRNFPLDLRNPKLWGITELFLFRHSENWEERISALRELKQLKHFHCTLAPPSGFDDIFDRSAQTKDSNPDESLFSQLALDPSSGDTLFPNLTTLEIIDANYGEKSFDTLRKMFQNRMSTVDVPNHARKALRTVSVSFAKPRYGHHSAVLTFHPPQYNGGTTSVKITGGFTPGTLEENFDSSKPLL